MEFTQEKIRRLSKMVRDMQLSDEDTQAIAEAQLKDMAIDPRVKTLFERFVSASNLNLYIDPSITSADFENALKSWLTFLVENPQTVIDDHFDPFLEKFYAAVEGQYAGEKKIGEYYENNESIQKIYKNKSEFINDWIDTDLMVETLREMGKFKNTSDYGGNYDVQFRSDIAELAGRLTKEDFYPVLDIETLTVLRRRALQEILWPGFELYINDIKKLFYNRSFIDVFVFLRIWFVKAVMTVIPPVIMCLLLCLALIIYGSPVNVAIIPFLFLFCIVCHIVCLYTPLTYDYIPLVSLFLVGVLILSSIVAFPLNPGIAIFSLSFSLYLAIKAYPLEKSEADLEKSATDLQNLYDIGDQNIKTKIESAIEAITTALYSEDNTKALSTGTSANASSTPTSVVDRTIANFTKSLEKILLSHGKMAKILSSVTSTQQSSLQRASMHASSVEGKNIFEPLLKKDARTPSTVSSLTSSSST